MKNYIYILFSLSSAYLLSGCGTAMPVSDLNAQPMQPLLSATNCQCDPAPMQMASMSTETFNLEAIYFDTDKASLRSSANNKLDKIAAAIKNNQPYRIVVDGNADIRGSTQYNQGLSERRANSVRRALIQRGVDSNLLEAKGYSDTQPVASNASERGMQLNRRVDVTLYMK
ncbi:OmpA family protein [Candidatus Venteria ishoeyi]|uniref:Photosystem I P700 chlorophyll a apoprotein A2 n=1 Tax=Candidatus Venteria ishoeyi TaxID=1899563 RepID=A0A1H6FER7_9GAMM|nr:OmpA family protein [Candidatus Venteria ishoeyi]SEH07525.1 Photosystem I P700 chlorophyll a apoprotein A2 [Candidatus Venteria ishoeyi]